MLEKDLTYSVASLLQNCNAINMALHGNAADLRPFINRLKGAFLPSRVYDLEEYGLPRMISRKIHSSGLLDLERDVSLAVMLDELRKLGRESVIHKVPGLSGFDEYILDHFLMALGSESAHAHRRLGTRSGSSAASSARQV